MLTLALVKNCRAINFTCLQHARQIAVCKIHALQPQKNVIPNLSSPAPLEHLSKPSSHVLVQKLHNTGIALKPNEGLGSYVFRMKGKAPSVQKKNGRFEFFSLRSLFSSPGPYMLYGLGGLIPFMSAPVYMHLTGEYNPNIAQAQLVYGACILSFLGGVSWGNHLNREKASLQSLSYSILLPLIAWPAVLLYPNPLSFLTMIGGIVYAGVKDTSMSTYPRWFKNLRFILSTLVALSLSTTLVFSFFLESGEGDAPDDEDKLQKG